MRSHPSALFLSAVLLLVGNANSMADGMPGELPPPGFLNMTCSPKMLRSASNLSIELPKEKGATFAAVLPDGNFRFISFEQPNSSAPSQPIVSSDEFAAMARFETPVRELQGVLWTRGGTLGPVFTAPGRYSFVVAETLETEDPLIDGYCEVDYRP